MSLWPEAWLDPPFKAEINTQIQSYFEINDGTASNKLIEWDAMQVVIRGHCLKSTWEVKSSLNKDIKNLEEQLRIIEIEAIRDPSR